MNQDEIRQRQKQRKHSQLGADKILRYGTDFQKACLAAYYDLERLLEEIVDERPE